MIREVTEEEMKNPETIALFVNTLIREVNHLTLESKKKERKKIINRIKRWMKK